MATLSVTAVSRSGVDDAGTDAAVGGDQFANTGVEIVRISNASGGSITVTIATAIQVDGEDLADKTVAVPAGESRLIGPFPTGVYGDSSGNVQLTYSAVTNVKVGVFSVSQESSPFQTIN